MQRKKATVGLLVAGFIGGFLISHYGLLSPVRVKAAVQHFFFNSVRVGLSLPPMRDFFATGDIIVSRRAFISDVIAGGLTDSDGRATPGKIVVRDEQARGLIEATVDGDRGGSIEIKDADGTTTVEISGGPSGGSIQLNGRGLDVAEMFEIRSSETVEPGHVVVIDPGKPGQLTLSTRAYDHRLAGVIAGAGGLHSGLVLGPRSSDSQKPVALSGRVYTWVDASHGHIEPGDLLTTSPTPGFAMKAADRAKAQGAILGKAMEGLDHGQGRILVLVNLQ